MLIDKYANKKRHKPVFEAETFYGQLQHIYVVRFSELCQDECVEPKKPIFLAAIHNCKLTTDDPQLVKLDIHLYTQMGTLDIIDITSVQALVGRVKSQVSGGAWAIIDRSGALARAIYEEELDIDE